MKTKPVLGLQDCRHGVIARSCTKCRIVETPTPQGQHTPPPVYAVEAGRLITRNGKPFVNIQRIERDYMDYVSPTDADKFTHDIVKAVNAHEELVKGILELRDRLTMAQDASGNSEINHDEIELCNTLLARASGEL